MKKVKLLVRTNPLVLRLARLYGDEFEVEELTPLLRKLAQIRLIEVADVSKDKVKKDVVKTNKADKETKEAKKTTSQDKKNTKKKRTSKKTSSKKKSKK